MILNDLNNINNNFFSVIIIGSGPAGISTALKLEELNIRTLLIEAGGLELDPKSEDFLKGNIYKNIGKSYLYNDIHFNKYGNEIIVNNLIKNLDK